MDVYYLPSKTKRKELQDVNDDFSLTSPARKIRRLEAELPPIMEEIDEECGAPLPSEFHNLMSSNSSSVGGLRIQELTPSVPENENRAIVLFNPTNNAPLSHFPSSFSVSFDPHLISEFRNHAFWSTQLSSWRPCSDDAVEEDNDAAPSNGYLAVVPWVPSQVPCAPTADISTDFDKGEMMGDEEMEEVTMDIDDSVSSSYQRSGSEHPGRASITDGLHQWQQQQCMLPQPPNGTVVWYR